MLPLPFLTKIYSRFLFGLASVRRLLFDKIICRHHTIFTICIPLREYKEAEMIEAVVLNPGDNIGVALAALKSGAKVKLYGQEVRVELANDIPYQHKFSIKRIATGMEIIKDGVVIGKATQDIESGQHVHTHNMTGLRLKAKTRGG